MSYQSTVGIVTVVGGALIHLTLGTFYTWGNISGYVASYMREVCGLEDVRLTDTAWILSATFAGQAIGMPLGGLAERRIGPQWSSLIGCLSMSLGVFASRWTLCNFHMFLLTYGYLLGFGLGFAYTCPLVCALKSFPERKGIISGCITAGFGAGALVFNQIQTLYVNPSNIAAAFAPFEDSPDELYFNDRTLLSRVPYLFTLLSVIYLVLQVVGILLLADPPPTQLPIAQPTASQPLLSNDAAGKYADMSLLSAIKSRTFWIIWTMFFLNGLGISFVATFWKVAANSVLSDKMLSVVGSLSSICNAVGRLFWGQLADKKTLVTSLICMSASWTILTILFSHAAAFGAGPYGVIICTNFFCLGGNFALFPTVTAASFGRQFLGTIYGVMFCSQMAASFLMAFASRELSSLISTGGMSYIAAACSGATCLIAWLVASRGIDLNRHVCSYQRLENN